MFPQLYNTTALCFSSCIVPERERERETERERQRHRQRQRQRDRDRETETETERHRETERQRQRQRDRETETEREDNTFLQKDTNLSTSRLFYKSVSDDKHSSAQYIKQEYK